MQTMAGCLRVSLAFLSLIAIAREARAEDAYPTRPVHVIVPFAPAGASDLAIRLLQPGLEKALGQQIIVDNRPGAAGNIGMELAARAEPDGYTLFFGNVGTISINPHFYADLKVNPDKDLIPISLVSETPGIFIARPDFPATSLKDMVAYVKSRPGKLTYAAAGISTLNTLEMEQLGHTAGLKMVQVPYKGGAGPAVNDLMGGHVDLMCVTYSAALPHVKGGKVKGLAVTTRERLTDLPDIPTVVELGYPESVSSSWQGLFAVAGTPQPIIAKLYAAIAEALKDPAVREHMATAGMLPTPSRSPGEFKNYLSAESAKWSKVVKELGIKPQ